MALFFARKVLSVFEHFDSHYANQFLAIPCMHTQINHQNRKSSFPDSGDSGWSKRKYSFIKFSSKNHLNSRKGLSLPLAGPFASMNIPRVPSRREDEINQMSMCMRGRVRRSDSNAGDSGYDEGKQRACGE